MPQDEGWLHRKAFEWTHCVYGLERLGALTPSTRALGVAAGHECVVYHLANRVGLSIATDLYGGGFATSIAEEAAEDFLFNPDKYAPFPYRREHLAPLPADALALPFADGSVDVVYSLSSIEHFGGHEHAGRAMREISRVLRPDGIACIATEYIMRGGPHPEYFDEQDLCHWVIQGAEDLVLVDDLDLTEPPQEHFDDPVRLPEEPLKTPHVVLAIQDWRFTSVVLFLRKRSAAEMAFRKSVRAVRSRLPGGPLASRRGSAG